MKYICRINEYHSGYFIVLLMIISALWLGSCKEMPSESEGPDNPLDPNNPNNMIQGPALVLSPTEVNINTGDEFQLELWLLETDSTAGMSTRITYDPSEFKAKSVDSLSTNSESFLLQNGGQLIWFSTINNDSGFVQIDCAVVEGSPRNVDGTGVISKIIFNHLSGTETEINISDKSKLRDDKNQEHIIADRIAAVVSTNE